MKSIKKEFLLCKVKVALHYILSTIKKTRIRTKIIYIFLVVVFCFAVNFRGIESDLPIKIESNGYSVYRDGNKYYVSSDDDEKYRISKDEFLRCVNKKAITENPDKTEYEIGSMITDTVATYEDSSGVWEQSLMDDYYEINIRNLIEYKRSKNKKINAEDYPEDQRERYETIVKRENDIDRMKYAWDDLCYKYKVKEANLRIYAWPFEDDYVMLMEGKKKREKVYAAFSTFIGYNSDLTKEDGEGAGRLSFTSLLMDGSFVGITEYMDLKDYMVIASAIGSKKNEKARRKLLYGYSEASRVLRNSRIDKCCDYVEKNRIGIKHNFSKTWSKGDEVLHIYANKKKGIIMVGYYRTNDYITRGLMLAESDMIVNNSHKSKVYVNSYLVVRAILFMIFEWIAFIYIGKKRAVKKKSIEQNMLCMKNLVSEKREISGEKEIGREIEADGDMSVVSWEAKI